MAFALAVAFLSGSATIEIVIMTVGTVGTEEPLAAGGGLDGTSSSSSSSSSVSFQCALVVSFCYRV